MPITVTARRSTSPGWAPIITQDTLGPWFHHARDGRSGCFLTSNCLGEDELQSLSDGVFHVLSGEEQPKTLHLESLASDANDLNELFRPDDRTDF